MLLYNWVNKNLKAPDGLFFDNIKIPSKEIDKRNFTYNLGTMLQSIRTKKSIILSIPLSSTLLFKRIDCK